MTPNRSPNKETPNKKTPNKKTPNKKTPNSKTSNSKVSNSKQYTASIVSVEPSSPGTGAARNIQLQVTDANFTFVAGQYLNIVVPAAADAVVRVPMSIASSPHRLPQVRLLYRSTPGMPESRALDTELTKATHLTIEGSFGDVCLNADAPPALLVAAGTGAAQALCMLEYLAYLREAQTDSLASDTSDTSGNSDTSNAGPLVTLLWCAAEPDEQAGSTWLDNLGWLQLVRAVDPRRTADNAGMSWLRDNAVHFAGKEVVLCGAPDFVYASMDTLVDSGAIHARFRADAFAYAPRQ